MLPSPAEIIAVYDPSLSLMEAWTLLGQTEGTPERVRAYLADQVDPHLERVADSKSIMRWILYCPDYPGVPRETTMWIVPEGKRFLHRGVQLLEGEAIRPRYSWDRDTLEDTASKEVITDDLEAVGRISSKAAESKRLRPAE